MPPARHVERHFRGGPIVRDVVLGMSDGLTVPFALAAGLAGAAVSPRVVVTAGLAEIAAGAIAMGLGGYLAARSDAEHYESELRRERREVAAVPELEQKEVEDVFTAYGLAAQDVAPLVAALRKKPEAWVDFMMRFELGLERPDPARGRTSALTIAFSYAVGGLVPLSPYLLLSTSRAAITCSVAAAVTALFTFGWVKGRFTGTKPLRSAFQTAIVGALAAAGAYAFARAVT
jgi:VIT1/CCC1 family predicted Fe2+/Mn2+ transporter